MKEIRQQNEGYAEIGSYLIKTMPLLKPIEESKCTIIYLQSNKEKKSKGKLIYGECEKVLDKNKWAIPAEYEIIIYDRNITGATDEQLKILIYHELLHINIEFKDGIPIYGTKPHDISDFKEIINQYGADWSQGMHKGE